MLDHENDKDDSNRFRADGFEYERNGETYLEYHVDTIPDFFWKELAASTRFGGNLSIRMPPQSKQLIIFGQDECIFNQFTLCRRYWVNKDGKRAILPKTEGMGIMISAFKSREFGFGFELTTEQLKRVNEFRRCRGRDQYSDVHAAKLKHGNSKKNDLQSSPFVRKFQYGANAEGYWSYEDMILQLEDCIDVLHALFGNEYNFLFPFDHSNGHD